MKPVVYFSFIQDKSYQEVWDLQTTIQQNLIQRKKVNKSTDALKAVALRQPNFLLFCEHSPVYTLGKSGSIDHLLLNDEELISNKIEFYKINRGGDITYHGPGQITGYPIFDLEEFITDVHLYVRNLEEAIIRLLLIYDMEGIRLPNYTGVWLPPNDTSNQFRKICAIGVHLSRWVSMHGFAFNVNTDINYFDKIIPCGIVDQNKSVTSLAHELGKNIPIQNVVEQLSIIISDIYNFEIIPTSVDQYLENHLIKQAI